MATCYTEPLALSAYEQGEDEEEKDSKSPQRSSSDESDESELEPPLASVVRRKVSFADAFGLDLVSVKEFDNRVESAEGREGEELHLSCIFRVPDSDEDLKLRLQQNKLELERIELLPGSTTIRGTVRVLNLSYHKVVYVRTSLDGWQSHFDKQAEYIPGSSDGETDRFSFLLTLMPPFSTEGVRVEFCLCYETSNGIFWANNGGMNYVLFCHKRGERALKENEEGKERDTEENNQKGKKSCLKVIKKGSSVESKSMDMSSELSEQESPRSVENKKEKTQQKAESRSTLKESYKTLAERQKRRKATQVACLQDYFSNRDKEVQLEQPSHQETLKDLNVVQPMQLTEDMSTKMSDDAWKAFLDGTDSLDKALDQKSLLCIVESNASQLSNSEYDMSKIEDNISAGNSQHCALTSGTGLPQCFTAMETLKSDPAKLSPAVDASQVNEDLNYKYSEKSQISSEPCNNQESESDWVQWGHSKALNGRHTLCERPFCEDEPISLTNPGKTVHAEAEPRTFKPENDIFFKEYSSSTGFSDLEKKVKENTHRVVKDTLTFTSIRNKPLSNSLESEKQNIDECGEPKKKKECIGEENENASQVKRIFCSEYSEDTLVALESSLHENDEEPSHLKDGNTEICSSLRQSVVCDEDEPHKQRECLGKWDEEDVYYELVKKTFSKYSESQEKEITPVEYIAARECQNSLKVVDQSTCVWQSEGDDYIATELHTLQSFTKSFPHTPNCVSSHTSSTPSGHFTLTESVNEGEHVLFPAPHKGYESEEILRYRVAQDVRDPGVGNELPSSYSGMVSSSVGTISSWLLVCWAKISTLSYITGALVCAILFLIFVTAYFHDLPVCLTIYLLSVCWWCRQGMKKHVTTADSVD
ncbi:hypothetical protein C0J45_15788 [Silurus meridionalis]|nr:hypothetical protein C0J45_15788 [Silurus meridionalis]